MNQLEVCEKCSSNEHCVEYIINNPEIQVKCIHFGCLKKYVYDIVYEGVMKLMEDKI